MTQVRSESQIQGHLWACLCEGPHSAGVRVLTKNSSDTDLVRSDDLGRRPFHVEVA